jgi:hypothetical protein
LAKLILDDVATTGANLETLITVFNDNMALIETEFDNVISRDGSAPNFLDQNLDMNGYCLLNVGCINFVPGGSDNLAYHNVCNQYTKGQATTAWLATINGGVYTPNACNSNVHRILLNQDVTIGIPTQPLDGQVMNIIIVQDGTGGKTVTWNPVFKWPQGLPFAQSLAANAVDVYTMQYDEVPAVWYVVATQDFF